MRKTTMNDEIKLILDAAIAESVPSIPDTIKIFYINYNVTADKQRELYLAGHMGEIDYNAHEISYIDNGTSDTVDTIIHEILHGLYRFFDYGEDKRDEEHLVSTLASGLTTVMKDNPTLFPALQRRLEAK